MRGLIVSWCDRDRGLVDPRPVPEVPPMPSAKFIVQVAAISILTSMAVTRFVPQLAAR